MTKLGKNNDEFCILGRPEANLSVPILYNEDNSVSLSSGKSRDSDDSPELPTNSTKNGDNESPRINSIIEEHRMHLFIVQFLGIALFFTCFICAFTTDRTSSIIWGSGLSLICTLCVILSYILQPLARRHPNSLIFYRSVCEFSFALKSLVFLCIQCYTPSGKCESLGFRLCSLSNSLSQFFLLAGEGWYGASIVDLFWSMTNPFTDYKRNNRIYHICIWITCGLLASCSPLILSSTTLQKEYNLTKEQLCNEISLLSPQFYETSTEATNDVFSNWREINLIYWGGVFAYIFILLVAAQIIIFLSWKRSQSGLEAALTMRRKKIKKMTFYVEITHVFWLCFIIVYFVYLFEGYHRIGTYSFHRRSYIEVLFNFLITGRGYFSFVVWFAVNDALRFDFSCSSEPLESTSSLTADYGPQMNGPLRTEVIFYTVSGIKKALRNASKRKEHIDMQELLLNHDNSGLGSANSTFLNSTIISSTYDEVPCTNPCTNPHFAVDSSMNIPVELGSPDLFENDIDLQSRTSSMTLPYQAIRRTPRSFLKKNIIKFRRKPTQFVDYAPHEFKKIRDTFGITDESYMNSLSVTTKERLSEGASGAFMFYSADGVLIVKSMSRRECHKLISMAQSYSNYMVKNPKTFITRFYGCHRIKLYGQNFYFVVMANIFQTNLMIHDRYDIKGSWINRQAKQPKEGELVTCRHCNAKYYSSNAVNNFDIERNNSFDICFHQPNVVMKDMELGETLPLENAAEIYYQIRHDGDFLCSQGILDYSLLIGIHHGDSQLSSAPSLSSCSNFLTPTHVGNDVYFMGIIDILETWNLKKKIEHYFKVSILCMDKAGISAVHPEKYRDRFQAKIGRLLGNPVQ